MITLPASLAAWNHPEFEKRFKQELADLDSSQLPLQQGLSLSNQVVDGSQQAIILHQEETEHSIEITAAIFYYGITTGCACADDPTPESEQNEYCELRVTIDKVTAEAQIELIADPGQGI